MDVLTIVALALIGLLVFLWIFYNRYTKAIIRDLIAENTQLIRDNKRLKADIRKLTRLQAPVWFATFPKEEVDKPLDFPNSQPVTSKEPKDRCY